MNQIASAFGKGTTNESALRQCWEDLEDTRLVQIAIFMFMTGIIQKDCKMKYVLGLT